LTAAAVASLISVLAPELAFRLSKPLVSRVDRPALTVGRNVPGAVPDDLKS
jgi:hypothetical protein